MNNINFIAYNKKQKMKNSNKNNKEYDKKNQKKKYSDQCCEGFTND